MGIVAYYLDVDAKQLAALKENPALVWNIRSDPRFAKATIIDVDKDWQILSWLASPVKRAEQCHETAWYEADRNGGDQATPEKFEEMTAAAAKKLGCPADKQESDTLLKAIEGRGSEKQREPALNFGLGGARVFRPEEVKLIAVSFSRFDPATLRRNFNRKEMARFNVGGMDWNTESDRVLDEFLVPAFRQVSSFYQRAARLNHHVLVIYQ